MATSAAWDVDAVYDDLGGCVTEALVHQAIVMVGETGSLKSGTKLAGVRCQDIGEAHDHAVLNRELYIARGLPRDGATARLASRMTFGS